MPPLQLRMPAPWGVLVLALAGCGTAAAPAPTATVPLAPPAVTQVPPAAAARIAHFSSMLRKSGFTPDYHIVVPVNAGGTLYVFHSICTGSADGHCHAVDAFMAPANSHTWHRDYVGVLGVLPARDGFQVRATSYAKGDKMCCPSALPVIDTYTWNGHSFTESGPLPVQPSG